MVGHPDDHEPLRAIFGLPLPHSRELRDARLAPRCPEIEQDHFAFQLVKVQFEPPSHSSAWIRGAGFPISVAGIDLVGLDLFGKMRVPLGAAQAQLCWPRFRRLQILIAVRRLQNSQARSLERRVAAVVPRQP